MKKFSPDIVIAVGGGSVLDYAKIVSILNPENIKNLNQNIKNNNQISNSKKFQFDSNTYNSWFWC